MSLPQVLTNLMSSSAKSLQARADEKSRRNFINLAGPIGYSKSEYRGRPGECVTKVESLVVDPYIGEHATGSRADSRKEGSGFKPEIKGSALIKGEAECLRKVLLEGELMALRNEDDCEGCGGTLTLVDSVMRKMVHIAKGIENGWDSDSDSTTTCGDRSKSPVVQRYRKLKEGWLLVSDDVAKEDVLVDEKISEDSIEEYVPTNPTEVEDLKVVAEEEESDIDPPDVESIGLSASSDEFEGIDLPDQNALRSASCDSLLSNSKFLLEEQEIDFELYAD